MDCISENVLVLGKTVDLDIRNISSNVKSLTTKNLSNRTAIWGIWNLTIDSMKDSEYTFKVEAEGGLDLKVSFSDSLHGPRFQNPVAGINCNKPVNLFQS